MRKESDKDKLLRYGSIYTNWSLQNTVHPATKSCNTSLNNTSLTNTRKPKIDLVSQIQRQKIRKNIYEKFVASTTDHEILCIIKPYMYSKTLPKMNSECSHQIVLDRIRKGYMKPAEECTIYRSHTSIGKINLLTQCYICGQNGTVYDRFCVTYRKNHEHIFLCISCGGELEKRGNVLFDKVGKIGYDKFIKSICYYKKYLPSDVVKIIMLYTHMLYDKVCIKY